jgi:RNA polymerase sigma-70 factor (ECF subfamily)
VNATSHSLLEELHRGPETLAWQRWHALYEPLIRGWLARQQLLPDDRDDVAQEVLAVVVRRLPEFEHNGRTGAFRNWLKTVTINCLRDFWKKQKHAKRTNAEQKLDEWADPAGALSKVWDREHDKQVLQKLLSLLEVEFAPATWQAFQRHAVAGEAPETVASDLGISVNAVYIAKSRVMTRLRQEAAGLVDDPSN